MGFPTGKNTGVGSHSLFQGIFPTQESNPGLLHCSQILYGLSHQGSPQFQRIYWLPESGVEGEWNRWRGQKVQPLSYKKKKSWGWELGITSHTRVSEAERGRGGTCERHLPQEASGTPPGAQGNLRPCLEKPLHRLRPLGLVQQLQVLRAASSRPLTRHAPTTSSSKCQGDRLQLTDTSPKSSKVRPEMIVSCDGKFPITPPS